MAEKTQSLELDLHSCRVCYEIFDEDGDHVPRLLPCTHTLCHSCIGRMIKYGKLECPECRVKHEAKNEEKSFPQNKYILGQLKRKSINQENFIIPEFAKCEEHEKELNLFCQSPGCEKPICRICLRQHHREHDVIDIEEHLKNDLLKDVSSTVNMFDQKVEILFNVKADITERCNETVEALERKRKEINDAIDEMKGEVKKMNEEENLRVDNEVSTMKSNIEHLRVITQTTENKKETSHEEILNKKEAVLEIKAYLSGDKVLNFPDFIPGRFSVEEFTGRIVRREVIWNLQESAPYRIPRLPQLTTGMRMLSQKANSLGCRKNNFST